MKPFAALLLLLVPAARALPPDTSPPEAPVYASDRQEENADPDALLLEQLRVAESQYEQGIKLFQEGKVRQARAAVKKAFALLTSSLEEDQLTIELKADFLSMLEKVRTWEAGETQTEYPSDLQVSAEVLEETPPAPAAPISSQQHTIEIDPENEITKKFIQLYTEKRPDSVREALERSGRYRAFIESELRQAGLPRELFYLVMTESEYKRNAVSRSGAAGLWQFMPFTARAYGLEVSYWVDERFDPEKATKAAIRHLSDLHQWFKDWHLALAAYNRGLNGIGRDLKFSNSADFGKLADRKVLPQETHNYVPKFMACVLIGEAPENYGIKPNYEEPEPYDIVELDRDLDLGIAAKCAGTTKEVIQRLNPHIRAWCTPRNRPGFPLRIPQGVKEEFLKKLAAVKDWNPGPELVRYKVRRGDYLGKIARSYRTTVKNIMQQNNIHNPRLLRPGMMLKIQPGKDFYHKKK
ncbi:MAG: transglycosylase SLT domain-containing protein [Elusimicrobiota bacterium]